MTIDDLRAIAATVRRCRRAKFCRPVTVTAAEEQQAIAAGMLRFDQWPLGHYKVTEGGRELLAEIRS